MKAVMRDGPFDGTEIDVENNTSGIICFAVQPSSEELHEIMMGRKEPDIPFKTAYYRRMKRPETWSGKLDIYYFSGIS